MDTVPFPEFFYQTIAAEFEGLDNPHDIARSLRVVFDELLAGTDLCGGRVLDAGCGYGAFSRWAAARGANVVSYAIAEKLVQRAGAVASSRGVVGDAGNLCFKDDAFEIVISSEMIEHTSRPPGAIRELVGVLRLGGNLVITTPNRVWPVAVRLASYLRLRPFHGLESFVRRSELRAGCTAPDLDVLEHIGFHAGPCQ